MSCHKVTMQVMQTGTIMSTSATVVAARNLPLPPSSLNRGFVVRRKLPPHGPELAQPSRKFPLMWSSSLINYKEEFALCQVNTIGNERNEFSKARHSVSQ